MIGKTLNHYEIIEPLGAGGMGEVYRAHDTTLKRDVAIKVLPEDLSADVERLARLEREAQLLAALNHPNIAAIYGLEEAETDEGTSVRYLILELIEGESLAEKLSHGRLEVEMALGIARQIAEALEAAHSKGIIHRDLKPGNVVIAPEGKAKVLDFGLAKVHDAETADPDVSPDFTESPTVVVATQAGIILGTAAYMSPEQARGKPLDKRTDIWSFGCVLYEMLTGRRPFEGETVTDVLAAIVEREPDWDALAEETHPLIHLLLCRCLEKDSYRRLHDIADARIEVVEALGEPRGVLPGVPPVAGYLPLWRRVLPWAAGVAIGAIVTGVTVLSVTRSAPGLPWQFEINLPADASLHLDGNSLALSPDGSVLVFVANEGGTRQLYMRRMNQLAATPIPGTEGALRPFFSPDGQWVAINADGDLKKVSLEGGIPFDLCENCLSTHAGWYSADFSGDWGPPDTDLVFSYGGSLWQIPATGGTPKLIAEPNSEEGETGYYRPEILPGTDGVLFEVRHGGNVGGKVGVAALSLDESEVQLIAEEGTDPQYAETGHVIYARGDTVFAVGFDPQDLRVSGHPTPILQAVMVLGAGAAQVSFSHDGTLAYVADTGVGEADRALVWVDRHGASQPVTDQLRPYDQPRLSPDGTRAAVGIVSGEWSRSIATGQDIWILEIEQNTLTRLTTEGDDNRHPLWTPDGSRVTFSSAGRDESLVGSLHWKLADLGGQAAQQLLARDYTTFPADWSPDGRTLVARENVGSDKNILLIPFDDDGTPGTPSYFLATDFNERAATLSPDGNWLAYVSDLSGRDEVYVEPFPGPGGRRVQVSNEGGRQPCWGPNGDEVFYRNGDRMVAVAVQIEPRFEVMNREVLFKRKFFARTAHKTHYDIHPDGQRFLMIEEPDPGESPQQINIKIVLNWFEELKRLVPTER